MSWEPEHTVCRVCRTSLNVETNGDGDVRYVHAEIVVRKLGAHITDHEPDPIVGLSMLDIVGICDFCSTVAPRWNYPCKSFQVADVTNMGMVADWAACTTCHDLIEAGDWHGLSSRSMEFMPEGNEVPGMQLALEYLHQQFASHRTGPAQDLRSA